MKLHKNVEHVVNIENMVNNSLKIGPNGNVTNAQLSTSADSKKAAINRLKRYSICLLGTVPSLIFSISLLSTMLTTSIIEWENESYTEWFQEREQIYAARRLHLRKMCIKYNVRHSSIKEPYACKFNSQKT